jgi:hypothetical protein
VSNQTPGSVADQGIELYPDEENSLRLIWAELSKRYVGQPDSKDVLIRFATECENRLKEIGLLANIDISNMEALDDGTFIVSPLVEVYGRVVQEIAGHDHERHAFEVKHGYADGVVGTVTPDGRLIDPGKLM